MHAHTPAAASDAGKAESSVLLLPSACSWVAGAAGPDAPVGIHADTCERVRVCACVCVCVHVFVHVQACVRACMMHTVLVDSNSRNSGFVGCEEEPRRAKVPSHNLNPLDNLAPKFQHSLECLMTWDPSFRPPRSLDPAQSCCTNLYFMNHPSGSLEA